MARRGVIFDLDGTLADTLGTITAGLNQGLAALGLPRHPAARIRRMVGEGVQVLCEKALPADRQELSDVLVERVLAFYLEHPTHDARLYPGIARLLHELAEAEAILAVLSNKPDLATLKTVDGLGIGGYFARVLGKRDDLPRKPDPTSVRWILEQLALAPDEVLYVGDTPIDMQTAAAAGLTSVAVTWGFRSRAELLAAAPCHVVDHPREIVPLYLRAVGRA